MFTKKKNPIPSLTVEAIQDSAVDDTILISMDEYKKLLRKEATLDLIANVCNDQAACKEFQYSWNNVLMFLCAGAGYTTDQGIDAAAEEEGDPF